MNAKRQPLGSGSRVETKDRQDMTMVGGLPQLPGQATGNDFFNCTHASSVSILRQA